MKRLILINGTMGVGKTTTCDLLLKKLPKAVFLDGDWCWNMHPFVVTEETKAMVLKNITCLLQNFLQCSAYENILFCWVIPQEEIFQTLLEPLSDLEFELFKITLTCSPEALSRRLEQDVAAGRRSQGVVLRSLSRLALYEPQQTIHLDVSDRSPEEASEAILNLLQAPQKPGR